MVHIKSKEEIEKMREGGKKLVEIFDKLQEYIEIGKCTKYLDEVANNLINQVGGKPAFLGYNNFPASICVSLNNEVVHGIPSDRRMRDGDIVSIDIGLLYKGMYTDMARTIGLGNITKQNQRLIDITKNSLEKAITICLPRNRVGDIGNEIEKNATLNNLSVVKNYVGHGVGKILHEDPAVPNYGVKNSGYKLVPGMTIAIEPMVNVGSWKVKVLKDRWTVVTLDGTMSAHFEHTVLITDNEPEVITKR
ncbi:type I methionyl aminopeptidase [bacterium]